MRAALFDMDGVLVDSEAVNVKLLGEYLERQGIAVPEQVIWDHIGAPGRPFWECAGRLNPGLDAAAAQEGYLALRRERGICYQEILYPTVKALLTELKEAGWKIGLASSTVRRTVEEILVQCAIRGYFDALVCGDDVRRGKPEPDIYFAGGPPPGSAGRALCRGGGFPAGGERGEAGRHEGDRQS